MYICMNAKHTDTHADKHKYLDPVKYATLIKDYA